MKGLASSLLANFPGCNQAASLRKCNGSSARKLASGRMLAPQRRSNRTVETMAAVLDRRWSFADMQNIKRKRSAPLDEQAGPPAPAQTQIFVMLPMDTIAVGELLEGQEVSFINSPSLNASMLDKRFGVLKKAGAEGVMLDVWWGICERHGPKQYDFTAYMELFKKARKHGLKVQAVMSFHAGGGNVGDGSCDIPLPPWVLQAGEKLEDEVFYTDKKGGRDHECLSLGCDREPVLDGRTPLQTYADFVQAFAQACIDVGCWGNVVTEICLGTGPCGELRYPAYQEKGNKWSYFGERLGGDGALQIQRGIPGIGEFQCYDKYMLADLREAALKAGNEEWVNPPREGAGSYDFAPWETEFFSLSNGAGWETAYGQFFMNWYSGRLVQHLADMADAVMPVVRGASNGSGPKVDVAIKVAGIHWWYKSRSHAAEMTAGYFNYWTHDGYEPIIKTLKEKGVGLSFTCIEMSDTENPDLRHCSPEGLVQQIIGTSEKYGIQLLAENALEGGIYNQASLDRMTANAKHFQRITLLRMTPNMFEPDIHESEGIRVKEPLNSFLSKFKRAQENGAH